MVLHGWLKFWTRLAVWFLNSEELKVANLTRCHTDTNLKLPVFGVLWKKQPEMLKKISVVEYREMNTYSQKNPFPTDNLTEILHKNL